MVDFESLCFKTIPKCKRREISFQAAFREMALRIQSAPMCGRLTRFASWQEVHDTLRGFRDTRTVAKGPEVVVRLAAKSFIAAAAMVVCLLVPSVAGPLEESVAAFDRGDYETVLRLVRPLAEQGDALAQGIIGAMYDKGRGVPQNYTEAVKWYRLSAEQGDRTAQSALGVMYAKGTGVPQDHGEAAKWYRLSAEQGDRGAQSTLGFAYAMGQGVPQNDVLAHMWLNLAAAQGDATATRGRDEVAKRLTPDQIAEAQRLAREWKPK